MRRLIWILPSVVALAAAARVGVLWIPAGSAELLPDEQQYWDMAVALSRGDGLRDELGFRAARMPLYPAFLSMFASMSGGRQTARAVQALLSALTSGLIAWLTFRTFESRRVHLAWIAGLLVAMDPFLVYFCRFLLTENLFTPALAALLVAIRPMVTGNTAVSWTRWLSSGVLAAGCLYLRPSCLGLLACFSVLMLRRPALWRMHGAGVLLLWAIIVAALCPWAARNRTLTGQWTWLTNRAGISLYDGVRPGADGSSDLGFVKQSPEVRGLDEVAWNQYFLDRSHEIIRREPGRILRLAGTKLRRTWSPWPNAPGYDRDSIKLLAGSWSLILGLAVLIGIIRCWRSGRRWTILMLVLPAIYFTALHLLFVGSVRYRLPTMPPLEILAAVGGLAAVPARPGETAIEPPQP